MDIVFKYGILQMEDLCCSCKNCIPLNLGVLSPGCWVTCKKHLFLKRKYYNKKIFLDTQYTILCCKKYKPILDDYGDIISCNDYKIIYKPNVKGNIIPKIEKY